MSDDSDMASEANSPESREDAEPVQDDDRLSMEKAQSIIERLLPDAEERQRILTFFSHSIRRANQLQPAGWATILLQDRVRLNINGLIACTMMRNSIWVAADGDALTPESKAILEQLPEWTDSTFRVVPNIVSCRIGGAPLGALLPMIEQAHNTFISRLAARASQAPSNTQDAHAPGVISYLQTAGFDDLEAPAYDRTPPDMPREAIEQAFATFDREYRELPNWRNWERDWKYNYVIERDGRRYPVKELFRIATGVEQFSGRRARAYLTERGYTIVSRAIQRGHAWLFQTNPRYYDLITSLSRASVGDEDSWTVTRYRADMLPGDPILLWLAGKESGIYAVGELTAAPVDRTYAPDEVPPWLARDDATAPVTATSVSYRYTAILSTPIRRAELLEHPTLNQLQVIRQPTGTNFRLTPEEWAALQQLLPPLDGSARLPLTTSEGRRAAFARFIADRANQFMVTVRRVRASQLRELLASADALTLEKFNQDIWRIESSTLLNGTQVAPPITNGRRLTPGELDRLEAALSANTLELHGNYIWRAATYVYHPHSKDEQAKLSTIRQAAAILTDSSVPPLEQAQQLDDLPGFGENTATGLVMVCHPGGFAIYNRQSQEALAKLGIPIDGLQHFQAQAARLREEVGAADFLELDAFLYQLNQDRPIQEQAPAPAEPQESAALPARSFARLLRSLVSTGLTFPTEIVSQYLLALQAKRFVILTGISGTGKTQLAMAVAAYYSEGQHQNRSVIAVRPDWTDQRGLLGFYNPLTKAYVTTPFLRFLLEAAAEQRQARREGRPPRAYFVVLDEMNLARVEYYFADFLSGLESGEALVLHDDAQLEEAGTDGAELAIPRQLPIPENLFFTGTVNVDETTSMFSPKVLDRAFTIEFSHVNLAAFGSSTGDEVSAADPLFLHALPEDLLEQTRPGAAKDAAWKAFCQLDDGELARLVMALHETLEADGRHFGYRVANEIARFTLLASSQAGETREARLAALDIAILTKVLPKLSGTQHELNTLLLRLLNLAIQEGSGSSMTSDPAVFERWGVKRGKLVATSPLETVVPLLPRTGAKLWMMLRRARQQGFTSFMG